MPVVIDATVGGLTANCYVTRAEADAYFESHISSAGWDAATNKDALLIHSSRLLDHYMDWNGVQYEDETLQYMQWPRSGVYDVDYDIIPTRVKEATYELANWMAANGTSVETADASKIRVGPFTIDLDTDAGYMLPPQISRLLTALGSPKNLPKNGVGQATLSR